MLAMGVNITLTWPAINHPHMIEVLKSFSFTSKPDFIITNISSQDYHKRFILWATTLTAVADFIFLFHVVICGELRNRSVEVLVPALFHSLSTGTHLAINFQHSWTWWSVWICFFFHFWAGLPWVSRFRKRKIATSFEVRSSRNPSNDRSYLQVFKLVGMIEWVSFFAF